MIIKRSRHGLFEGGDAEVFEQRAGVVGLLGVPGGIGVGAEGSTSAAEIVGQGGSRPFESLLPTVEADLDFKITEAVEALQAEHVFEFEGGAADDDSGIANIGEAARRAEAGLIHPTGDVAESPAKDAAGEVEQGEFDGTAGGVDQTAVDEGWEVVCEFDGLGEGGGAEVEQEGEKVVGDIVDDGGGGFTGDVTAGEGFAEAGEFIVGSLGGEF